MYYITHNPLTPMRTVRRGETRQRVEGRRQQRPSCRGAEGDSERYSTEKGYATAGSNGTPPTSHRYAPRTYLAGSPQLATRSYQATYCEPQTEA